jgi:hypothetical protein
VTVLLFGEEENHYDHRHQYYKDEDALHVVNCESLFVANIFKLFIEGFVLDRINLEHELVYQICWNEIKSDEWEKLLEELANVGRVLEV